MRLPPPHAAPPCPVPRWDGFLRAVRVLAVLAALLPAIRAVPAIAALADALPGPAWQDVPGGRRAPLPHPADGRPGFTELVAADLGIRWTNQLAPARYATRQNLMNGAGLALADVDGDGWCDLFLCNKDGPSALYRNLGGWRFEDITEIAGVSTTPMIATGAVFGDVNADGRPDLFVTSFLGPDALHLNLGGGRFTNVTASAGVTARGGTTSAAFGDIDGDGDLDLYVCHFGVEAILRDGAAIATRNVGGQPVVMGRFARRLRIIGDRMVELGDPDVLFVNDGQGRFTPAPWGRFIDEDGKPLIEAPPDFGLSVLIRDLDGNGAPDIFLCNDFQTPDRIWLGDGRGGFRAAPRLAFRNMSYASMGVDVADLTRSGRRDIFTVEMLSRDHRRHLAQRSPMDPAPRTPGDVLSREMVPRNTLHHDRGDGTYAEVGWFSGIAMSDWSWTPIFVDVDLDGFEDLLVSNGHMHDVNDMDVNATRSSDPAQRAQETSRQVLLAYPTLNPPKAAWRNRGDLTFEDRTDAWHFNSTLIIHGLALADLDQDGDPDVIGNAWNHPPLICRNDATAPRVAVRLRGRPGNPTGVGARVRLTGGPVPQQDQEMRAGGRYLSNDQPQLTFATGTARELSLDVLWRSGAHSVVTGVLPGHLYELDEASASPAATAPANPTPTPTPNPTWFKAVPIPGEWTHRETAFDDFARQRLLPWRHSRLGPSIALLQGDGPTQLILGAARGDTLKALRILPSGVVEPMPAPPSGPLPDDTTALLAVELVPGRPSIFAGLSHFESGDTRQPSVLRFDLRDGAWIPGDALPPSPFITGALAVGDFDGDGDPDLVVAGRFEPGRYPEPADIRIFRNDAGRLILDEARSAGLRKVGMITGAAVADFNQDGRPDMAVACEWGPLRIFLNDGRILREPPDTLGLAAHPGLWQCVATGDFDGDGRMDLAAGNWGRNSYHQRSPAGPWELWFGPVDNTGPLGLIEAYALPGQTGSAPFRPRDTLASDLPWLKERFPRHQDFARTTVAEILKSHAASFQTLRVTTLASALFLNRGARFDIAILPPEAQWTPVLGMASADLDGDGHLDLACTQNLYAVRDEDDRHDTGRGLLLRNRGGGRWEAVHASESGISIPGDQRAIVSGDLDGDGRTDLAITQNAGAPVILRRAASR